jgi:CRISPR-associated protein Cas2
MPAQRQVLVSYDVVKNKHRNRLARFLRGFLLRVQKSVFEGVIEDRRLEPLRAGIAKEIDLAKDSVRVYLLCEKCRSAVEVIGTGVYIEEDDGDVVL